MEGLLVTYEKKAEETLVIVVFPSEKVEGELTLHWRFYNNRRQEKMSMLSISVANFVNHHLLSKRPLICAMEEKGKIHFLLFFAPCIIQTSMNASTAAMIAISMQFV